MGKVGKRSAVELAAGLRRESRRGEVRAEERSMRQLGGAGD